jgi:hypothetical protein
MFLPLLGSIQEGGGRITVDPPVRPSPLFPPLSGSGRGEGQVEPGRALAGPMLPYAEVKTALNAFKAARVRQSGPVGHEHRGNCRVLDMAGMRGYTALRG